MKLLSVSIPIIIVTWTILLYAQSQETIDAIQDARVTAIERDVLNNEEALENLTDEISSLTSSISLFTGVGIGFGATLTAIQLVLVIFTVRNRPKETN